MESGQRSLKSGWTIQKQTEHFRHKLLKKSHKKMLESPTMSTRRDLKRSPNPVTPTYSRSSRRSPSNYGKKPSGGSRSRSRSYSSSPKRYARDQHSLSLVRLVKYDSPQRKQYRYE